MSIGNLGKIPNPSSLILIQLLDLCNTLTGASVICVYVGGIDVFNCFKHIRVFEIPLHDRKDGEASEDKELKSEC